MLDSRVHYLLVTLDGYSSSGLSYLGGGGQGVNHDLSIFSGHSWRRGSETLCTPYVTENKSVNWDTRK